MSVNARQRSPVALLGPPLVIVAGGLASLMILAACLILLVFAAVRGGVLVSDPPTLNPPVGAGAGAARIPGRYLALYRLAAQRYGLDWTILAGIGRVECDHGQDTAPSCTVEGALNSAGAGGPAQFLGSTWARYGVSASGDAPPDRWNPADAILSMANYLRASGAPQDYQRAIFAYNHAGWYVAEVLWWAARYRAQYGVTAPSGR